MTAAGGTANLEMMQKVAGGDDCFLCFQKGTVTVNHRDGSTNTEEAMLYQCNLCDDGEVNKCDKGHGGSVRHVCQDKHLKNLCKLQVGDEVQETPNSLAWHQLPKAMTKYRKLNTTQHTAREAKKQRQGQLQAGIAMALGGEAAAAIATGLC